MLSFIKDEPPFRLKGKTSVLDNWNEKRKSSLEKEEPPQKRLRTALIPEEENSFWPFDWDWNGLFLHDFPLLDLPDTVLLDVLKMVDNDSRRELSFTNQKLRGMIVRNKTIDMDRRRSIGLCDIQMDESKTLLTICKYPAVRRSFADFDGLQQLIREWSANFVFHRMNIDLGISMKYPDLTRTRTSNPGQDRNPSLADPDKFVDFESIITVLCEISNNVCVNPVYLDFPLSTHTLENTQQSIDIFFKYPHLKEIALEHPGKEKWNEYCTTVTERATAYGIGVRTNPVDSTFMSFRKIIENGRSLVEITHMTDKYRELLNISET